MEGARRLKTLSDIAAVQCYDSYCPGEDNMYDCYCRFRKAGHDVSAIVDDRIAQTNPVYRGYLFGDLDEMLSNEQRIRY